MTDHEGVSILSNGRKRRRREIERYLARVLTHDFLSLSLADQAAARMAAYLQGRDLADSVVKSRLGGSDLDEGACGDLSDYRRTVVRWAHEDVGAIAALDRECWRHAELSDARLREYQRGFLDRLRELGTCE